MGLRDLHGCMLYPQCRRMRVLRGLLGFGLQGRQHSGCYLRDPGHSQIPRSSEVGDVWAGGRVFAVGDCNYGSSVHEV